MAALSSLHPHFLHSHPSSSFHLYRQGLGRIKYSSIICCKNSGSHQQIQCNSARGEKECVSSRREMLFQSVWAYYFGFPVVAMAAETDLLENVRVYTDETFRFKITIPQDWQVGNGKGDGVRSLTAFVPPEDSSSNVSLVITGLGADFTKLESFGKVDAFAETLVSGLDRSWQRPPGVAAKLINSKAANGLYYIEYTLKNPGESRRNLVTVLGVANDGTYNRLYTLTGQFVDEEEDKFGIKIRKSLKTLGPTADLQQYQVGAANDGGGCMQHQFLQVSHYKDV